MYTLTHRLIGETIGLVIRSQYPDRLNEKSFQYGCMIPDYHYKLAVIPHYKDKSFEFIMGMIQKARKLPQTMKEKQRFATELGIITHYICDYFCQAHNYPEYGNCMHHLVYEGKLSQEFKNYDLKKFCVNRPNYRWYSLANLPAFINNRYLEYRNEKRLMKTDISFCLNVAATVALTMVANSDAKWLQLAA